MSMTVFHRYHGENLEYSAFLDRTYSRVGLASRGKGSRSRRHYRLFVFIPSLARARSTHGARPSPWRYVRFELYSFARAVVP